MQPRRRSHGLRRHKSLTFNVFPPCSNVRCNNWRGLLLSALHRLRCAVLPPPPDATWRCRPREQATDQSVAARCIQSRKQHRASIQVRGGNSCAEGDEGRFQAFLPPPVLVALYRLLDVGLLCLSLRCPAGSSLQYSPGPTACNRPERSAATSLRHCWTSSARWSN